ncbi:hypothetical protein BN1708_017046, partial [Verticillium longisporum]
RRHHVGDQPRPQHPQPLAVPPRAGRPRAEGPRRSRLPRRGREQQVPGPRGPRPADAREPAGRRRLLPPLAVGRQWRRPYQGHVSRHAAARRARRAALRSP